MAKRFSIWGMEFLHPAMWHDHDIDFARWLHPTPAMWHVALESWQWIHQVTAPCNVTRGSGMTCHWIRQVTAPCNVALKSWQWIRPVAAPCNVTRSSRIMTLNSSGGSIPRCGRWLWDDMPLNSPKRPTYRNSTSGFDFGHITASTCHSAPVCEFYPNLTTIGRKKWRPVYFLDGVSQPSWIVGI